MMICFVCCFGVFFSFFIFRSPLPINVFFFINHQSILPISDSLKPTKDGGVPANLKTGGNDLLTGVPLLN